MKNRRGFLAALTPLWAAGTAAVIAARARAQTPAPAAKKSRAPGAIRRGTESEAPAPSAAALALAARARGYDPQLTDVQIEAIARGIDANRAAGSALNPKRKPLRNGDEPVTRFAAAERIDA
jgi:hypothetical protein